MVRIIFTPKSVENHWVKNVKHEELATKVLLPSGPPPAVYRIALCEDGKPGVRTSAGSIGEHISALFRSWGVTTRVQIDPFTFHGNTTEAYQKLVNADMFYFAGVFSERLNGDFRSALKNSSLVEILRGRVQCNEIAYLAVCGGAMLSGCLQKYDSLPHRLNHQNL